jgi:hypothetical protein
MTSYSEHSSAISDDIIISGKRKMEFVPFFGPHKAKILILSKMCGKF